MPDENNPEDVNSNLEDHAWDETRYALLQVRRAPEEEQKSAEDLEPSYKYENETFTMKV